MGERCGICGFEWDSEEQAAACEEQGLFDNGYLVGDWILIPIRGGHWTRVVQLIDATYIDHEPGILVEDEFGGSHFLTVSVADRYGFYREEEE